MDCAIDCTFDELTGSGSVATAASIADCRIAIVSGEKDAFARSLTALLPANASSAKAMQAGTSTAQYARRSEPSRSFTQNAERGSRTAGQGS
jgi:hypothetical protein